MKLSQESPPDKRSWKVSAYPTLADVSKIMSGLLNVHRSLAWHCMDLLTAIASIHAKLLMNS